MEKYRELIVLAERIVRYLEGKLSDTEKLELERDLQGISDGKKLLERVRDPKTIIVKKEIYTSFDAKRSWNEIQKATRSKSSKQIYRMFWYAAILILPLAVAVSFLYVSHFNEEGHPNYIVNAYFESHKTMLELPGGQMIALDTVKNVAEKLNQCGVFLENGTGLDYTEVDSVADSKVEYHRIIVPRGGEYNLKLADGTRVWVFAESEIRFPTRFKGNKREVYLEGEAYFDVCHDSVHPFYVKTKSIDVKVLGTSFNVKAYRNTSIVETSLVEGVVSVKDNVLRPNMQATYHEESGNFSYRGIKGENYRLRKERMFVFEEERLDDILQEMARWYDFEVFYRNPEMAEKRFGFKLEKYEHVDSLLKILELTGEVKFEMNGKTLIVKSVS